MRALPPALAALLLSACIGDAPPGDTPPAGAAPDDPGFGETTPAAASILLSAIVGVGRVSMAHYLETDATRSPDLPAMAQGVEVPAVDEDEALTLEECVEVEKLVDEVERDFSFTASYAACDDEASGSVTVHHGLTVAEDASGITEEHAVLSGGHQDGRLSWTGETTWVRFESFDEDAPVTFAETADCPSPAPAT